MISLHDLMLFIGAALVLVLTPGPNMIYVVSRSICQGRTAGVISLLGVMAGFAVHMTATAIGLTALFMAVPFGYEVLKWAGIIYLLYIAWQAVKPGSRALFEPTVLPPDSPRKLFLMGFLTNLLNPKVAIFYLSLIPQFIRPEHGSIFAQSMIYSSIQIFVSSSVNLLIALSAAQIATWFARNPRWLAIQRYVMGFVLAALAVRLVFERRHT